MEGEGVLHQRVRCLRSEHGCSREAAVNVIGLDLSLRSTGWAIADDHGVLDTADMRGPERLDHIMESVRELIFHGAPPCSVPSWVIVEGPSFASRGNAIVEIGKLHGLIEHMLWHAGVPYVIGRTAKKGKPSWGVPPGTLKKYATGSGNCSKTEMVVSCRERLGYDVLDDNVADALWLRHVGLELLGEPEAKMPKAQVEALKRLEWSNDG